MVKAEIIADSISTSKIRLTTLQLRYPKFIHGEFMTHRVFSRNASSSRAIPIKRLIQDVIDDPALPVMWFKNKPGMQGTELCSIEETEELIQTSLRLRDIAVAAACHMIEKADAHKQHINRILEPWYHINVVVTATEWSNFFALRCHPDADPTMRALADAIRQAMHDSEPRKLMKDEWHLPYVSEITDLTTARQVSAARCARVSYLTQDGKQSTVEDDLRLCTRLAGSIPLHASPFEHQATPDDDDHEHEHGNFKGWRQWRKMILGESQ